MAMNPNLRKRPAKPALGNSEAKSIYKTAADAVQQARTPMTDTAKNLTVEQRPILPIADMVQLEPIFGSALLAAIDGADQCRPDGTAARP